MKTTIESEALRRGLPSSPDAETAALGSCLLAGELLPEAAELRAQDFTTESRRMIFSAIQDLAAAGVAVEDLTLVEHLDRKGQLDAAGGIDGVTALTEQLPRYTNIGTYTKLVREKSALRRIVSIAQAAATMALEQSGDAGDIAGKAAAALLELDGRSAGEALSIRDVLTSPESRGRVLEPRKHGARIPTGFRDLDRITGGLEPGTLIVLAARPSTGKTALTLNIAANVARTAPVAVFTLESSREALVRRLLCSAARIDSARHRDGVLDEDEQRRLRTAVSETADLPLTIIEASGSTVERIHAQARKLKARTDLGLVVIDYLQLLASAGRVENRTQEVSALSRGVQRMAADLKVPVLALSQLSRAPETRTDPRPRLSDLRESGAIEQDADQVWFLFRPELYQKHDAGLYGIAELDVAKHRDGPTGVVPLAFQHKYTRFEARAL